MISNCVSWYLPKGVKTYVHTKISTQMFIAALFIIATTWHKKDVLQWVSWWIWSLGGICLALPLLISTQPLHPLYGNFEFESVQSQALGSEWGYIRIPPLFIPLHVKTNLLLRIRTGILKTNFEYLEAMEEYKNGLNVKIYIVTLNSWCRKINQLKRKKALL